MGLAIWYMDDGNVTTNSFAININRYIMAEAIVLKDFLLERFGLIFHINRNGDLFYLLAEYRELFIEIINQYVPPIMQYKLKPYLI